MEEDKNQNQELFDNTQSNNSSAEVNQGEQNQSVGEQSNSEQERTVTEINSASGSAMSNDNSPVQPMENTSGDMSEDAVNNQVSDNSDNQVADNQTAETPAGDVGVGFEPTNDSQNENTPDYPIADENKKTDPDIEEGSGARAILRTIIIIVIIAVVIWFFNRGEEQPNGEIAGDNETVNMEVNNGADMNISGDIKEAVVTNDEESDINKALMGDMIKITAFYAKSGENNCAKVYPLAREIEKKYDQEVVNTIRGLLAYPSAEEQAQGFTSNIPVGTYLTNVFVDGSGVATIRLNENLNRVAGSCAVISARAQIEQTLLQFPYVKSVVICAGDNCNQDEILQP